MQTGDGLLARIRVQNRILSPAQLAQLARLAAIHGNGILEVSARGTLQARGLRPETAPLFAEAVSDLVLLETGLVVDTSPLAGDDPTEIGAPVPLAAHIRHGARAMQDKLAPKVSVIVDGSGQVSLAALKADIRLVAVSAEHWAVYLGGGKPQIMDKEGALSATLAVLGALAALGAEARATDFFPGKGSNVSPPDFPNERKGRNLQTLGGYTSPITLPFGQMQSAALFTLAEAAEAARVTNIRLAPAHRLLIDNAPVTLIETAATLGFITDPVDPRLRASACIGDEGCASGHIPARRLAADLAGLIEPEQHLHVSGCAKGCAHPSRADVTLVGRADGIGLVINGGAGDTPSQILDEAELIAALVHRESR